MSKGFITTEHNGITDKNKLRMGLSKKRMENMEKESGESER